ncbi:MAG: hypothetical protein ACM3ML_02405 [Micromonosporaceae bacterium]
MSRKHQSMSRKHQSAGRYGVTQRYADGGRAGMARNPLAALAIAVPVVLAAAIAVVAASAGKTPARKQALTGAVALARLHRAPLPMPTASPPAGSDCSIIVPPNPLTARGLATPYQLYGPGCTMADTGMRAFVQATILDPATGRLSVYEPLVIDRGSAPAAPPVVPTLPKNAVVTIDLGFNGDNLTQVPAGGLGRSRHHRGANSLRQGRCVNGLPGSVFGQVSYCNGPAFYWAARKAIKAGTLKIPALGTGKDGQPCPTTRSFTMVDQDQSDNVTTRYLLTADGRTAQDNAANAAAMSKAAVITNGSDDALLDAFLDPALGCTPFTAPDLSNPGTNGTSQALNELQAYVEQPAPRALVPVNDPMTQMNGSFSVEKTNLYRVGVGQFQLPAGADPRANARTYCSRMIRLQVASLKRDQSLFTTQPPADPAVGDTLFTFLAARLSGSFDNLNCGAFGMTNPVHLTLDGQGVATGATFGTAPPSPSPSALPTASPTASGATPTSAPQPSAPPAAPTAASPAPSSS